MYNECRHKEGPTGSMGADERMFAMAEHKFLKEKPVKYGLPFLCVAILALVLALRYGFFFSTNDDSLLEAILSGAFSGSPETHDMYHLYPLSCLFALLYRICPLIPWYGLSLFVAQFGVLYLGLVRCAGYAKGLGKKAILCVLAVLFFTGLMLQELILIQYTVTSAMMADMSVFLLITDEREEETLGQFMLHRFPCIALYAAAFMLRSEMGLFLLPFMVVGCVYKWLWDDDREDDCWQSSMVLAVILLLAAVTHNGLFVVLACLEISRGTVWCLIEEGRWRKRYLLRYSLFLLCLTGIIGALYALDTIAYRSEEWKEARDFCDSRTSIYDFGKIPAYAESRELYEKLGISEEEQMLLENYNFALSDAYDSEALEEIEAYQTQYFSYMRTVEYVKKVILDVVNRMTVEPDLPYSIVLIALYAVAVFGFVLMKRYTGVYFMTYVLMAHMICWCYLTWKNRLPDRVTHGLYLTEIVMIAAILLRRYRVSKEISGGDRNRGHIPATIPQAERRRKLYVGLPWVLFGVLGVYSLCSCLAKLPAEISAAQEAERNWETVRTYCESNPEELYLLDTLSFASYVEKVFDGRRGIQNYTLCGGWSVNMPAWDRKLAAFGVQESLYRSIQERKEFYFIMEDSRDIGWMRSFFETENLGVKVQLTDVLAVDGGMEYEVYRITPYACIETLKNGK